MMRWIGKEKGMEGIPGIPGRDLTDEEVERRGLTKEFLLKTGLYVEDKPAGGRPATSTLDTLGISSGTVKKRIEALEETTEKGKD